jgi:hypothetical protein
MLRERLYFALNFSEDDPGQGWQTLRVLAQIVHKLLRNLFTCQWEF